MKHDLNERRCCYRCLFAPCSLSEILRNQNPLVRYLSHRTFRFPYMTLQLSFQHFQTIALFQQPSESGHLLIVLTYQTVVESGNKIRMKYESPCWNVATDPVEHCHNSRSRCLHRLATELSCSNSKTTYQTPGSEIYLIEFYRCCSLKKSINILAIYKLTWKILNIYLPRTKLF